MQFYSVKTAVLFVATFSMLVLGGHAVNADVVLYTVPNTPLQITLMGRVTINPGGTLSLRHPRGTLHFSARDCKVIKTDSKEKQYVKQKLKSNSAGTAVSLLDLALWCVEKGMLKQADLALGEAWAKDPTNSRVRLMAQLVKYRRGSVPVSASVEQEMRDFVKRGNMKFTRSRHFVLLHDTPDEDDPIYRASVAEHRLKLLEQVYDSFYMKYALEGYPLRVPKEPLRVVLFNDHGDYLAFVTITKPCLENCGGLLFAQREHRDFLSSENGRSV